VTVLHYLLLGSGLLVGCLLAIQASVNLQLNKAVGTPYGASTVQLSVAAGLLLVLALVLGALGSLHVLPDIPKWHLLGGLASPLYITSGILLFPRLGAVTAVGLFVTGQMFASLALDLGGLLGVPSKPWSVAIVIGVIAVLAGIVAIVRGQKAATAPPAKVPAKVGAATATATSASSTTASGASSPVPAPAGGPQADGSSLGRLGWTVLGIVAGAVLPIQGAINAKLRGEVKEPIAVGLVSFTVAVITIVIVTTVLVATRRTPVPDFAGLRTVPCWGWLGGACAATYVIATFLLIPNIGAATTVALTVTGQQVASAAIDQNGLFRLPRRPLTSPRLAGLGLLVAGSLLVQLG
jgi:bacterial/archaeal transporter family-2 protein